MLPLTIRHVFDFGSDREVVGADLMRPEAWDALRTQTSGVFALPGDRATFEAVAAGRPDIAGRAAAIAAWCAAEGVGRLASYGVGGATLEYLLWRERPSLELVLSDYAPATVERLRAVFPEVEVRRHDLHADAPVAADAHLFHRIDTDFTNRELRDVLRRFGGERVLVVAPEVIGWRRAALETRSRLRNPNASRAGWMRNRTAYERLWRTAHDVTATRMYDMAAWDLRPR